MNEENEQGILAHIKKVETLRNNLIAKINTLQPRDGVDLLPTLDEIYKILVEEPSVRVGLVVQQGVSPVIEILEFVELRNKQVAELLLSIIEKMCNGMKDIKENFCLLGGIPPVMKFLSPSYDVKLRQIAVRILIDICEESPDNTQMFIACNGVSALVTILGYDVETEWGMLDTSVKTIVKIFDAQRATQKADFCRLFTKAGVLKPMSNILVHFATETDLETRDETIQKMIDSICGLLNTFSQADQIVKMAMSDCEVLRNITGAMFDEETGVKMTLTLDNILDLCKVIKYLGMESEARDNLASAHALDMACELIKYPSPAAEHRTVWMSIRVNLIMFLDDMCKLARKLHRVSRVGVVAQRGILPHLRKFLDSESELKSMSLSVIMELYVVNDTDKESMEKLIDDGLIDIYIDNLTKPYWCAKAIYALSSLFSDDKLHIEGILTRDESLAKMRQAIELVNEVNAPSLVQQLTVMCDHSPTFVKKLVSAEFCEILIKKFNIRLEQPSNVSQVGTAALLDLLRSIFKVGGSCLKYLKTPALKGILERYAKGTNVRQSKISMEILNRFK